MTTLDTGLADSERTLIKVADNIFGRDLSDKINRNISDEVKYHLVPGAIAWQERMRFGSGRKSLWESIYESLPAEGSRVALYAAVGYLVHNDVIPHIYHMISHYLR